MEILTKEETTPPTITTSPPPYMGIMGKVKKIMQ